MPRYTVSREKFPVEQKFKGTKEHQRRVRVMATHYDVSQQEVIRRCIDHTFLALLFLTNGSVDRSDRQTTQEAQP